MNITDIVSLRLTNQHLSLHNFTTPTEVVKHLGAVQAQDFPAAKWGLGIRMENGTNAMIEEAYNNGSIIRTHIMRPTWHFVMPEDLVWIQRLTSSQVKKLMGHYNRKLELTDELFAKTEKIIVKALANKNYLTRQELKKLFEEQGIITDVQRLGHIIMWAELDAVICNGPRRGKQFTYALVEERVPHVKALDREASLAKLAEKYFTSHGPAQIKDFAWWSGLSMKDSTEAVQLIKSSFTEETIEGKTYWFSPATQIIKEPSPTAHLLSIYDEYTIAYKDRSALGGERYVEKFIAMGNALTAVMLIDGKIVGTWKRALKKSEIAFILSPLRELTPQEYEACTQAAEHYATFFEMKATIT